MGMLDAYSIVNAGGPGLYNRTDANNGGAPGTVADKVNNQMSSHRAKAAALLGGDYSAPAPSGGMGGQNALAGLPAPANQPQNALAQQPQPFVPQINLLDPRMFMRPTRRG
jgi:hypothetical protein